MKKLFTLSLLSLFAISETVAQPDCSNGRYTTFDLFSSVDVTSAVTFGNNTALNGSDVDLKMDVYQPSGDTETDRPVVIMAFGGSFIGGARADVAFMCNILAKMGYVAVAPDYRVGFFLPSEVTTTLAVLRGAHDINACVRFLKKSAAEDGNPYGIDCERIVVGGISAGAIAAIHSAYLDKLTEVPSYMVNDTAGLGGVEGHSGTPDYNSTSVGVLSFSGAIGDTSWIEAGDAAIVSVHEELDNVVPYLTQEVSVSGFPTGLIASGSAHVHLRADNVGVPNDLKTYLGVQDHVGYLSPIDQSALDFAMSFIGDLVCGQSTNSCEKLASGIADVERNAISVYPNPTKDQINFSTEEQGTVEVIDATGRTVLNATSVVGQNRLNVSSLPAGVYTLRTIGKQIGTAHFIKE
ncbi:MAG: T9SS type A sorting domain-containing protein [Flavobacteriales bacterium]|nr:T9SS type A sorting domain-containing protein [Flavobacteriales bacterium]